MEALIFPVVDIFATLTLIGGIIAVSILVCLVLQVIRNKESRVIRFVKTHGLGLMLTVALVCTLGSLFLSEVAGWAPCKLCWLQRIFMYPQVVLLSIAIYTKDRTVAKYVLALCIIGAPIALYHYYEQIVATFYLPLTDSFIPCDDSGVSCTRTYTFRYGYITVPMMALTGFVLNGIGSFIVRKK